MAGWKDVKPSKTLLAFIFARGKSLKDNEPVPTKTHLQKEIFLYEQKFGDIFADEHYVFKPGWYGPFSKELSNDLEDLVWSGLVSKDRIELTVAGFKAGAEAWRTIDREKQRSLITFKEKYNRMNYDDLIKTVYDAYPDFTTKSALREDVVDEYVHMVLKEHDVSEDELVQATSLLKKLEVKD